VSGRLRRVSTGIAAWTVGAVASVAVSMLALTVIGGAGGEVQPPAPRPALETGLTDAAGPVDVTPDSPTPSPTGPASAALPAPRGSAASASTDPSASPSAGPPRQFTTYGGVLTARCTGQLAYLVSWSPAPGYRVDDVHRGPATLAQVSFVSATQRLAFGVRCVSGVPRLAYADE
jgi:hypothetical protein